MSFEQKIRHLRKVDYRTHNIMENLDIRTYRLHDKDDDNRL